MSECRKRGSRRNLQFQTAHIKTLSPEFSESSSIQNITYLRKIYLK